MKQRLVIVFIFFNVCIINLELLSDTDVAVSRKLGRPILVELYTSQGCSSCPPADKFLGELVYESDDVIPLSFHVDYWNYIGWKDPFSAPDKSKRQRKYAQSLGLKTIYTPQIVIDGRLETVGSNRSQVLRLIEKAKNNFINIPINVEASGNNSIQINIAESKSIKPTSGDIILITYNSKHSTNVGRGENRGKRIVNYNIVQDIKYVGVWEGEKMILQTTLPQGTTDMVLLLQEKSQGRIFGIKKYRI